MLVFRDFSWGTESLGENMALFSLLADLSSPKLLPQDFLLLYFGVLPLNYVCLVSFLASDYAFVIAA